MWLLDVCACVLCWSDALTQIMHRQDLSLFSITATCARDRDSDEDSIAWKIPQTDDWAVFTRYFHHIPCFSVSSEGCSLLTGASAVILYRLLTPQKSTVCAGVVSYSLDVCVPFCIKVITLKMYFRQIMNHEKPSRQGIHTKIELPGLVM